MYTVYSVPSNGCMLLVFFVVLLPLTVTSPSNMTLMIHEALESGKFFVKTKWNYVHSVILHSAEDRRENRVVFVWCRVPSVMTRVCTVLW